jgi:hypothetical protein
MSHLEGTASSVALTKSSNCIFEDCAETIWNLFVNLARREGYDHDPSTMAEDVKSFCVQ